MGSRAERIVDFLKLPLLRNNIKSCEQDGNHKFNYGDILMAKKLENGREPFLKILKPIAVVLKYYESNNGKFYEVTMYSSLDSVLGDSSRTGNSQIHVKRFMEKNFQLVPKGVPLEKAVQLYNTKNK